MLSVWNRCFLRFVKRQKMELGGERVVWPIELSDRFNRSIRHWTCSTGWQECRSRNMLWADDIISIEKTCRLVQGSSDFFPEAILIRGNYFPKQSLNPAYPLIYLLAESFPYWETWAAIICTQKDIVTIIRYNPVKKPTVQWEHLHYQSSAFSPSFSPLKQPVKLLHNKNIVAFYRYIKCHGLCFTQRFQWLCGQEEKAQCDITCWCAFLFMRKTWGSRLPFPRKPAVLLSYFSRFCNASGFFMQSPATATIRDGPCHVVTWEPL